MDLLLIFYSVVFVLILISPFFLNRIFYSRSKSFDSNERKILLDNLRDLKAELDTGKINFEEFEILSIPITEKLETLKVEIHSCKKCGYELKNLNAKFCENCGAKILQ